MNKNGKDLVALIKNLLRNENNILDNPDYQGIYDLSKFHSLQNILYYALNKYIEKNNKMNTINAEILKVLNKDNRIAIGKCATQEAEMELLEKSLTSNQINYMLLKGSIMKHLYPSIDMRSMADIDIYYDKSKSKVVKKIMKELGYSTESYLKGNHDCYLKDPFMNVEMHRELMNDCYEMSKYFHDSFNKLIRNSENPYKYNFKVDDYYIFMVAHSAKHFSNGGTGIRNVIDEYIYLNKYLEQLDFNYINTELDKLGLIRYEENLRNLAFYWFDDTVLSNDEINLLEEMSNFIINSGTYGTITNSTLNSFMGENVSKRLNRGKFVFLLNKAFPNYKNMCQRNPIIKKIPILLPWFYFTRLLKAIFVNNKMMGHIALTTKKISKEDIEKNKKIHDDIGA